MVEIAFLDVCRDRKLSLVSSISYFHAFVAGSCCLFQVDSGGWCWFDVQFGRERMDPAAYIQCQWCFSFVGMAALLCFACKSWSLNGSVLIFIAKAALGPRRSAVEEFAHSPLPTLGLSLEVVRSVFFLDLSSLKVSALLLCCPWTLGSKCCSWAPRGCFHWPSQSNLWEDASLTTFFRRCVNSYHSWSFQSCEFWCSGFSVWAHIGFVMEIEEVLLWKGKLMYRFDTCKGFWGRKKSCWSVIESES